MIFERIYQNLPFVNNELWQGYMDSYFNTGSYYPNIGIDRKDSVFILTLILGILVAIAVSFFYVVYNKRVLGDFVRKVLAAEALSLESAKTLEELGASRNFFISHAVKKSTALRRVVRCKEEEEHIAALAKAREEYEAARSEGNKSAPRVKEIPYKINPETDRFYIPEDMKYMADIKFDKTGSSWGGAIFCATLMVVLMILVIIFLPNTLDFINNLFAS